MPYLGNDLSTIVKQGKKVYEYVATAGQTAFTGADSNGESLDITINSFVAVFLNGIRLIVTDDYTVSTNTITLTSAASLNDELIIVADIEASVFNTYTQSETDARITSQVNALIDAAPEALNTLNELAAALGDDANFATTVTNALNARYTSTEVDNLLANINSIIVSATEPTGASEGQIWYDTNLDILKAYDGANWNKVSPVIPTISSISGSVYETVGGNITITGTGFLSGECSVEFSGGFTTTSVNATASSDTTLVVAVPAAAYASSGTVNVKVTNPDNGQSASSTFSVNSLPTGGTITTSGSYRIHTFTSSGTFTNTIPNLTCEYLVIAGGASGGAGTGGDGSGGGGAGGYRCSVPGESSGGGASAESTLNVSAASHTVIVGAGGSGVPITNAGNNGANSSVFGITSIGGGGGGSANNYSGKSGGSGGGRGYNYGSEGSGTSGQGYSGGGGTTDPYMGCGGGGAGSAGYNSGNANGGNGGSSVSSSINGSSTARAGGGGGGAYTYSGSSAGGYGGGGGAGNGGWTAWNGGVGDNAIANTGSGGGGSSQNQYSGNGGSGVVIIRYQL